MGLPRRLRLRSRDQIRGLYARGRRVPGPLGLLLAGPGAPGCRLCAVFPRRLGGAVQRNLARRRLQAAFAALVPGVAGGWDFLWRGQPAALTASLADLTAALALQLTRAGAREQDHHDAAHG